MSCRKCNKKVSNKNEIIVDVEGDVPAEVNPPNDNFWCKTCNTKPQFVIPRYFNAQLIIHMYFVILLVC